MFLNILKIKKTPVDIKLFNNFKKLNKCVLFLKVFYEFKDISLMWYKKVKKTLLKIKLITLFKKPYLFYTLNKSVYLLLYINDFLIINYK